MYTIKEHKDVEKVLKKAPDGIKQKFIAWKRVIENDGPKGLRLIKGFHDEALKGEWKGCRSSRLSRKWRIIYRIDKEELVVYVVKVNVHKY
jgi:addiction module RelE/StbE family toxin